MHPSAPPPRKAGGGSAWTAAHSPCGGEHGNLRLVGERAADGAAARALNALLWWCADRGARRPSGRRGYSADPPPRADAHEDAWGRAGGGTGKQADLLGGAVEPTARRPRAGDAVVFTGWEGSGRGDVPPRPRRRHGGNGRAGVDDVAGVDLVGRIWFGRRMNSTSKRASRPAARVLSLGRWRKLRERRRHHRKAKRGRSVCRWGMDEPLGGVS